jgi:protein SCO1/2
MPASRSRTAARQVPAPQLLCAVALVFAVSACKPQASTSGTAPASTATESATPGAASAATPAPDGRHALTGTIVSASAERGTLLVDHDEIPGFMPAMTMEFKVSAGDVANAQPGARIRGVLYQAADGFHLEQIWPEDQTATRIIGEAGRALRQDTVTRGAGVYREIGENLPDFALYDQSGVVVQASRFRGKQVVLNFIFTRCPDPHMCPAAVARFIGLQAQAREAGVTNLELVSISLDPEYDTPGVLREFAETRGIDTSNFSLLTGPERAIKDLLRQLGVETLHTGPLVRHTMATLLIDDSGKLIHRVDGSTWSVADFLQRLRRPTLSPSADSP